MYPMKMIPSFKDYLWGGHQLVAKYGKITHKSPVAESWEISCHPDGPSMVANGEFAGLSLVQVLHENPTLAGNKCSNGSEFPILVKLIDAKQSLSIQVHPDDEYAKRVEGQLGKNEMWYVVDAQPGAALIMGCNSSVSKEELHVRAENNTLQEVVHSIPVKSGDCFQIHAGMLHAIGGGVLIAEIQQSSNVTYRVSDFGRLGADGKPRPLHIDRALEVIDQSLQAENNAESMQALRHSGYTSTKLANWQYFGAQLLDIETTANLYCDKQSFQGLLVLEGELHLAWAGAPLPLGKGESVFVPAGLGEYCLKGMGKLLFIDI